MPNATRDWIWNENSAGFGLHKVELRGRVGLKGASAERCEGKRTSASIDNHWKKGIVLLTLWHRGICEVGGTCCSQSSTRRQLHSPHTETTTNTDSCPCALVIHGCDSRTAQSPGGSWLLYTCIHRHPKECVLAFSLPYTGYQHEMCTNNLQNPKGSIPEEQISKF